MKWLISNICQQLCLQLIQQIIDTTQIHSQGALPQFILTILLSQESKLWYTILYIVQSSQKIIFFSIMQLVIYPTNLTFVYTGSVSCSKPLRASKENIFSYIYLAIQPLQTQKHYALPLIRQSQNSYQPSQRQLQRQLPRSTMLFQVPNQLRLAEEAIQSGNPRR
ncbi:Hypothetical_protein [Hexamita inflata]|uniref:Hypothetical_protein n=1 Tax=Hexamita inflata TaxID=28002 RepID=A0AA86Q9S7_9EUKA|nr:Hypothetical protein HINF_LOCUS10437 [Hexamita inflata]CAI9948872.1 Hypothetical protein HINF_LOCUS36517 [Hexamita inflata]